MSTEELDAVEAFIDQIAARPSPAGSADADAARERAGAARENADSLRQALASAGVDLRRLDTLAAERDRGRRARIEQTRRRAIDASDAVARRLADLTPVLPDDHFRTEIIDRVTFIRSFADAGVVVDSHIGSLDSWARYRLEASADAITESGLGRLSFFTVWRNRSTDPVVVSPGAQLKVNAHLSVDAEWNGVAAWFISGSEARATVRARMTVWALSDSSIRSIVHDRLLGDAGATGGFFGGDDSATIAMNEFLMGTGVTVPGQSSILIELEVLTEWVATSGSVELDAESGGLQVGVPYLILTLT